MKNPDFENTARILKQRQWAQELWNSDDPICVYCGDFYQCRDHYICCNWLGSRSYQEAEIVPCCNECNYFLKDKPIFTIADRSRFLYTCYQSRARQFIEMPEWSQEELAEMGYNMRNKILNSLALKEIYHAKLTNLRKNFGAKM